MKRHTIKALLLGAAIAAVAAAPASAGTSVAVAGGLGGNTTRCTLVVHKKDWSFSSLYNFDGSTTCTVAVTQSCSVTLGYGTSSDSLFGEVCSVAGEVDGDFPENVVYTAQVTAPAGQKWLVVPNGCSGINSTALSCTLTAGSIAGEST